MYLIHIFAYVSSLGFVPCIDRLGRMCLRQRKWLIFFQKEGGLCPPLKDTGVV